ERDDQEERLVVRQGGRAARGRLHDQPHSKLEADEKGDRPAKRALPARDPAARERRRRDQPGREELAGDSRPRLVLADRATLERGDDRKGKGRRCREEEPAAELYV